jgi:hypothetical protein
LKDGSHFLWGRLSAFFTGPAFHHGILDRNGECRLELMRSAIQAVSFGWLVIKADRREEDELLAALPTFIVVRNALLITEAVIIADFMVCETIWTLQISAHLLRSFSNISSSLLGSTLCPGLRSYRRICFRVS